MNFVQRLEVKQNRDFEEMVDQLEDCLVDETRLKRIATGTGIFLSNWTAAKLRFLPTGGKPGTFIITAQSKRRSPRAAGGGTTCPRVPRNEHNPLDCDVMIREKLEMSMVNMVC